MIDIENNREQSKQDLLQAFRSRKKGFSLKEAAEFLRWKDTGALEELVEELRQEGRLMNRGTRMVCPENWGLIPVKITKLMGAFAFARKVENDEELFIPGRCLMGALPGDIVLVEPLPQQGELPEGTVQKVVSTGEYQFTGVFHRNSEGCYIGAGKSFREPVRVLPQRTMDAQEGEKVLAAIVKRGERTGEHRAAVLQRFGSAQEAKNCCESVLVANGVVRDFPQEALEQAEELCQKGIHPKELESRLDLRDRDIFTIDGADSKDLDDAVSIEKTERGWSLGVHIADVSYYVTDQSPLDRCAFERGTSIYYADSVIPMLPKALSNGICSLNPMEDRLTLSCLMELDESGGLLSYEFKRSVIRSRVKGVYKEVNAILDGTAGEEILEKYRPLIPAIRLMGELAQRLIDGRASRGGLELSSPEPKFVLDEEGRVLDILPRKRGLAECMIEEFMLLANGCAAKLARREGLPFIYRIHEQPAPDRLNNLCEILGAMGVNAAGLRQDASREALAAVLESVRGQEVEPVVNTALIRSMAKAKYSPENKGHFGLALEDYTHFTSPIRRYPDLSIHRIISAHLLHMRPEKLQTRYAGFASSSAQRSSEMEVRAMTVERECEDCYKAEFMTRHIGEAFDGIISAAAGQGLYVELENTVEGLVRTDMLPEGEYDIVEQVQLTEKQTGKRYRVGDPLRIVVVAADVATGRIDFGLPGVEPRPRQVQAPPRERKPVQPKPKAKKGAKKGVKRKDKRRRKKKER